METTLFEQQINTKKYIVTCRNCFQDNTLTYSEVNSRFIQTCVNCGRTLSRYGNVRRADKPKEHKNVSKNTYRRRQYSKYTKYNLQKGALTAVLLRHINKVRQKLTNEELGFFEEMTGLFFWTYGQTESIIALHEKVAK